MSSSPILQHELQSDSFLDACLPGTSPATRELRDKIQRLNAQAKEVKSVLLLGETGVGKTYVARIIAMHRCWLTAAFTKSERWKQKEISDARQFYVETRGAGILESSGEPFREVNVPTLEGDLAVSQLFGHKKGAYTGALKDHMGFLGLEGDILLDEIGYASLDMQRRFLQVLQSGQFFRLKSTSPELAMARMFAATNQNLQCLVNEGKFQADLWWRLMDHILYIPPLRERQESIDVLTRDFVTRLNQMYLKGDSSDHLHLMKADLQWAVAYPWPGNVRELEKTVGSWFFQRGSKSLQNVHREIVKFLPALMSSTTANACVSLNEIALRDYVESILARAMNDRISVKSPQALLKSIFHPLEIRSAEIVVACIDQHGWVKEADLKKLFNDVSPSTARSWLSRVRSGLYKNTM